MRFPFCRILIQVAVQVDLSTEEGPTMEVAHREGLSMTTAAMAVMVTMGALSTTMTGATREAPSILGVGVAIGLMGTAGTTAMAIQTQTGHATMRLQQPSQATFAS